MFAKTLRLVKRRRPAHIVFDWGAAREAVERFREPVILAGGLNPDNCRSAMLKVRPWGLDVSSGVESAPGKKDLRKVSAFLDAVRDHFEILGI